MQGITNTELQFQMAIRDQIIYSQREMQRKLWDLLSSLGLGEKQILELGAKQGITADDINMITSGPSNMTNSPNLKHEKHTPLYHSSFDSQSGFLSPGFFPQERELGVRSFPMECQNLTPALFREEHHASYYYLSHGLSPSIYQRWCSNHSGSCFGSVDQPPHGSGNSFPQRSSHISHYEQSDVSNLSFNTNFRQQQLQQVLKFFYKSLDICELVCGKLFPDLLETFYRTQGWWLIHRK